MVAPLIILAALAVGYFLYRANYRTQYKKAYGQEPEDDLFMKLSRNITGPTRLTDNPEEYYKPKTLEQICEAKCGKGRWVRDYSIPGNCRCLVAPSGQSRPYVAPKTTTNLPRSSGSSGNCSWDTKGGWCWKSTACGSTCRGCLTNYKTANITTGCNAARNYFVRNSGSCPMCKCVSYCKTGGGTPKLVNGRCQCYAGTKISTPARAGSSGNCSWDTKGGWCWSSSACGKPCKGCITNYRTTNIQTGCGAARNYFLKNSGRCPGC